MDVKEVQRRLWEQSQEHRERREQTKDTYRARLRNLMDLMHHPVWLNEAANR